MKLIVVSGLSGAGKSVALHTLEDLGYYCTDNLPVSLLEAFAERLLADHEGYTRKVAVGIDARNPPEELSAVPTVLRSLHERGVEYEIFFLDTDDETLLKRFSETRRRHPLSRGGISLAEAIGHERELMKPLAAEAGLRLDTSHTTLYQLRELIRRRVEGGVAKGPALLFQSFGYKKGVPGDADFVFDARCLPNPYWEPRLRGFTGRDTVVREFLEQDPLVEQVYTELRDLLARWLPRYHDSRAYITVAIGCTGGQHRSVYLAERLAAHFERERGPVLLRHRDLP